MPTFLNQPTVVPAAGNLPKTIEEFVGRVNSGTEVVSVARMTSPSGWIEPAQAPEFMEITVVVSGEVHVKSDQGVHVVGPGQAIITHPGETVQYSTPEGGAQYFAICVPAFHPDTVHRIES